MQIFRKIKPLVNNSFIKFCCVGTVNTAIDFAVFFTLHSLFDFGIIISNIISFSCAVTNSYIMNKFWSFQLEERTKANYKEFLLFSAATCITLFISTSILVIGHTYINIFLLKIIATGATLMINFSIYRLVIFRPKYK